MTVTEQTTQQTMERASTVRASVELNERGGSVSMDGTFHALRASNVEDARMEALELLRRFAGDVGGPVTVRSTEPSGVFDFLINPKVESIRKREEVLSVEAGARISKIYDLLLKNYLDPQSPDTLKSLNLLCVRIVFCLCICDDMIRLSATYLFFIKSYRCYKGYVISNI